ncbi:MAG: hypothetical protein MZV63_10340 [Marinilabiliales bacterium]|nr:hypothetical protein [Marinilabiliales bacterium]
MMFIEQEIVSQTVIGVEKLYHQRIGTETIQVEKTNPEFEGDYTLVVFPLLRYSKKSPQITAEELGAYLISNFDAIESYSVVKGFLNLTIRNKFWIDFF